MSLQRSLLLVIALTACTAADTNDMGTVDSLDPASDAAAGDCIDNPTFFRDTVQPTALDDVCMSCHTANGAAAQSDFVLVDNSRPDQLEVNRAVLADLAGLERDGTSILLLKPLGEEGHGGGRVLTETDPAYAALAEFVERVKNPVECEGEDDSVWDDELGLELLSSTATLRKAMLTMASRLPTEAELAEVRTRGDEGLSDVIRTLVAEEASAARVREIFADVLLTDRYLRSLDGLGLYDGDRFKNRYWYEYDAALDYNTYRYKVAHAAAREPLELVAHVYRNDLPFSEILTADYTMVNAYSALSYGLPVTSTPMAEDPSSESYYPAQVPGQPHAGILTTNAWLARFPTTPTNKNRHRSWITHKTFLATDILKYADRPIDPTTSSVHNPTSNDPQCSVCHDVLDPVAGAYQNWDDDGDWSPPDNGWNPEMAIPGFGSDVLPSGDTPSALAWLAAEIVADARFPRAMVRHMLHGITGMPWLLADEVDGDTVLEEAAQQQVNWVQETADRVSTTGLSLQDVAHDVLMSRWFRATGDAGASEASLATAGTARFLSPEQLERRIELLTGISWATNGTTTTPHLYNRYNMLYGGVDYFNVTERLTEPNGVMASVTLRMGTDLACEAAPRDFVLPRQQRRLFPWVEPSYVPETADGFAIPGAENAIRENIRHLHAHLLGEDLSLSDPEIQATYELWHDTWKEGEAKVQTDEVSEYLDSYCRATTDWHSGAALPSEFQLTRDDSYTIRAWLAVTTYLLTDSRFLFE
ncbi:MAG: DUF1592 domain-containing protein [Myxococcota bacterium]